MPRFFKRTTLLCLTHASVVLSFSHFVTSDRRPWCTSSSSSRILPAKAFGLIDSRGGAREHSDNHVLLSTASSTTDETVTVSAENLKLLSERGQLAILNLIEHDKEYHAQQHVYGNWPPAGTDDDGKRLLAEQLADLDSSYPGGLAAYLSRAKTLLKESADGVNPFSEYEALVPEGESLTFDHDNAGSRTGMTYSEAEQLGIQHISGVAFVLVAGGLGERLGYSDIKLSLETNLCTNKSYLEGYIKYIQAMQYLAQKQAPEGTVVRTPLVIMTSGDTDAQTRKLLKDNTNFGHDDITIVMQDKVAALKDGFAGLALEDNDRWTIQTKPHGHGDVHHLLWREGLIDKWEASGKTHVIFLQDTNALAINSVVPTLGVSVAKGFHMNSICIPRLAGEAAGAIVRLEHKTDPEKSLVINVEYNQLDPLLRTQGDCKGDVADPATGYSPFPGNANNLVMELGAYAKTLRGKDQGVVVEFVNPKYKDDTRTVFKKPTRLECMMQDIPKLFQREMGKDANIGFTMFERWLTFSPAKNSLESGVEAVNKGSTAPGTMSSAESDKYIQNQRKLKFGGMKVESSQELVKIAGIPVTRGPRVILCPAFGITQKEILEKIEGGRITERSSLVLEGHHLKVRNLDLDGALIIRAGENTHVTVDGLVVRNKGWELEELDPAQEYPESVRIRGYVMNKRETREYLLHEPGNYAIGADGVVRKLD